MAPRIVIYYHKLATPSDGIVGKTGYRATFKLDRQPVSIAQVASKFTPILNATKAAKNGRGKEAAASKTKVVSKSFKAMTKRSSKAFHKKPTKSNIAVVKQAVEAVPQLYPCQILIGSIPVELPSTVSVMATSVKQEENVAKTTTKIKVVITPKRAKVSASSPEPLELASGLSFAEGKQTSTTWNQRKKRSKARKGPKGPRAVNAPQAALYPLSAYSADKSQDAKSEQEKKKWAFISGFLLAKEALYGQAAPCMATNKEGTYSGPVTRARARIIQNPCIEGSSSSNQQADLSRRKEYRSTGAPSQQVLKERYDAGDPEVGILGEHSGKFDYYVLYSSPKLSDVSSSDDFSIGPHGEIQDTVMSQVSSVSSNSPSPRKGSMVSCDNPLCGDPESLFQEDDFPSKLAEKFQKELKIIEDPQYGDMPVLVTGTTNVEEQLQDLQRRLAAKDAEIAALAAQVASQASFDAQKRAQEQDEAQASGTKTTQDDLRTLIAEGIRDFQASMNPPVVGYRKPYPAHYDAFPFPHGYQKPTFEKFDGINGSPHEHLAHFYSACGESSQTDALLIRQFVQSLKGAAFTWYTQLQPGSILTWDDMQRAFLAQFVSSKKKVSIMDLADATQKPNESVNDFITRWRNLSLQCSEKLTELSAVQMCSNNLNPDVAILVGTAEPQTFDALVSKASNVERQLARKNKTAISKSKVIDDKKNEKPGKEE